MQFSNSSRYFVITEKQEKRFQKWIKKLKPPNPYDEDCCGTSYFEWRFLPSGRRKETFVADI